jgi:serine/threonine-protein phosphatase 2A activator
LLREALPDQFHRYVEELNGYLCDSFGNSTRLDYGTGKTIGEIAESSLVFVGHELAFAMFLLCLCKIEALVEQDSRAIVLKLFARYVLLGQRVHQ